MVKYKKKAISAINVKLFETVTVIAVVHNEVKHKCKFRAPPPLRFGVRAEEREVHDSTG